MRSVIEEPATGEAEEVPSSHSRGLLRTPAGWALLLSTLAFLIAAGMNTAQGRFFVIERFQTFVTIFLGIFIEAVPFLLAGSLVSGLIDVFVGQDLIERFVPRQPILAALAGACLGLAFPVCECGVVPVTRRLYEKGLPPSVGVAFLLAAPVINPVVIVSTWAAFGGGPMLVGRIGFTIVIAFLIGLIFQTALPQEILLPDLLTSRR